MFETITCEFRLRPLMRLSQALVSSRRNITKDRVQWFSSMPILDHIVQKLGKIYLETLKLEDVFPVFLFICCNVNNFGLDIKERQILRNLMRYLKNTSCLNNNFHISFQISLVVHMLLDHVGVYANR